MQDKKGKFVPAKPVPGTVCINVGDLLQQWTNDVSSDQRWLPNNC